MMTWTRSTAIAPMFAIATALTGGSGAFVGIQYGSGSFVPSNTGVAITQPSVREDDAVPFNLINSGFIGCGNAADKKVFASYLKAETNHEKHPSAGGWLAPCDPVALITDIRRVLSLPMQEMASLLSVTRQTLYGWLRGTAGPGPREENLRSLRQLHRVAREWEAVSRRPLGSRLRWVRSDGKTLLELLHQNYHDIAAMRGLFRDAAAACDSKSPSEVWDISAVAQRNGLDLTGVADVIDVAQWEWPKG